jgi:hypothetical protein
MKTAKMNLATQAYEEIFCKSFSKNKKTRPSEKSKSKRKKGTQDIYACIATALCEVDAYHVLLISARADCAVGHGSPVDVRAELKMSRIVAMGVSLEISRRIKVSCSTLGSGRTPSSVATTC